MPTLVDGTHLLFLAASAGGDCRARAEWSLELSAGDGSVERRRDASSARGHRVRFCADEQQLRTLAAAMVACANELHALGRFAAASLPASRDAAGVRFVETITLTEDGILPSLRSVRTR